MIVEIRPLVQACWAYLPAPSPEASARLVVKEDSLTVTWSVESHEVLSQTVFLPRTVPIKFKPCEISSLIQEENFLSFRVQTLPKNLTGSFAVEVIESDKSGPVFRQRGLRIPCNTPCSISCSCCGHNILKIGRVTFKRVLPLPSCLYDANDFFCHNHGESSVHTNPNEADCLYSSSGFHIHPSLINVNNEILHCTKCFAWIGTKNNARACLWHSTVNVKDTAYCGTPKEKLLPVQEFIHVIKEAIQQCPTVACRLLLEAKVKTGLTHFLLMNVIDRQLVLLTSNSHPSVELKSHTVIKVSFLLEKNHNLMVSKWSNDPIVICLEVALPVLVQGLKHLSSTSQLIPSSYRKVQQEFLLAYLCEDLIEI